MKRRPWRRAMRATSSTTVERARLVGLHREAEAAPVRVRRGDAVRERLEHIERSSSRSLSSASIVRLRSARAARLDQLPTRGSSSAHHPLALRVLVAREAAPTA